MLGDNLWRRTALCCWRGAHRSETNEADGAGTGDTQSMWGQRSLGYHSTGGHLKLLLKGEQLTDKKKRHNTYKP